MDDAIMNFVKDYVWVPTMGLISWGWAYTHKKIEDNHKDVKELITDHHTDAKKHTDKEVTALASEVTRQRDVSAKLFDKLEDSDRRATQRHLELLKSNADSQREIMQTIHSGLAGKADK